MRGNRIAVHAAAAVMLSSLGACNKNKTPTEPTVSAPTISRIATSPTGVGLEAAAMTFTAEGTSSTGTSYSWNFGDGSTSTGGASATHAYANAGTYTVQVSASNSAGQASSSSSIRVVSLRGIWQGTVTGHTRFPPNRPIPITAFEIRLNQSLPGTDAELNATWADSAGCRADRFLRGSVSGPNTVRMGVEQLLCNDGDFYLSGTTDAEGRVVTGTCSLGGPNCKFTMTRQ